MFANRVFVYGVLVSRICVGGWRREEEQKSRTEIYILLQQDETAATKQCLFLETHHVQQ